MSRPWMRRHRVDDEELPPLPPLDDEADEGEPSLDDVTIEESARDLGDEADDVTMEEFDLEGGPESGLLQDSEEAGDADVGDLADEIAGQDGESWAGDEKSQPHEGDVSLAEEAPADLDEGDDGIDEDVLADLELPARDRPEDPADDLSEWDASMEAGDVALESRLPAFALESPARAAAALRVDGTVFAAASVSGGVIVAGDAVWLVEVGRGERPTAVRRLTDAPPDDPITALAPLGGRAVIAATSRGEILRSEDGGARWLAVANLGVADARTPTPVELFAANRADHAQLWARVHGGALLSSDDRGDHWEGPALSVRACAIDPRSGEGVVMPLAPANEARSLGDPTRRVPLRAVPLALACAGDGWAFAFAKGPGIVSGDAGRTATDSAFLTGATALALLETDDGAMQLVAAVHDDVTDRSTLIRAGVARDGNLVGVRRIADLNAFGASADGSEEPQNRIETIVPFGSDRLLLVASGGVAVVESG